MPGQLKSDNPGRFPINTALLWSGIAFVAILTMAGGMIFLDDRKYYFISLLLIFYAMVPFFVRFEGRKPQSREVVILAVMVAIGVA